MTAVPTGRVYNFSLLTTMSCHRKFPQVPINCINAIVTIAGADKGIMIFVNFPISPHPSIVAISRYSLGIVLRYCLKKNNMNADIPDGSHIANKVLYNPSQRIRRKEGIRVICPGITIVNRNILNRISFPLNRFFANAYPAITLIGIVIPTEQSETIKEFRSQRKTGYWNRLRKFCNVISSVIIDGGTFMSSVPCWKAPDIIQIRGMSRIIAIRITIVKPMYFIFSPHGYYRLLLHHQGSCPILHRAPSKKHIFENYILSVQFRIDLYIYRL